MAATRPAVGPSSSNNEPADLYGALNPSDEDLDKIAEANELFDAVLTGSVNQDKKITTKKAHFKKAPSEEDSKSVDEYTQKGGSSLKKLAVYIGNFPWWTSDTDLTRMAQRVGVKDIKEIKFAENRANGQSRGYAEIVVKSQESLKILLEKIPLCLLNGEQVDCRFASRHNIAVFEEIANQRVPPRVTSSPKESDSEEKVPISISPQEPSLPPLPPPFPLLPPPSSFPSSPNPFLVQPPPLFPHMFSAIPPPLPPHLFPPHPVSIQQTSSMHINPAFFNPTQEGHSSKTFSHQKQTSQSPDADFEELMNRNRTIASSAISKAVSGATAGDLRMGMETLLTAIAIIKQSRVYGDERCQALVTSLKDCLVSIQGDNSYREKERDRDRGRERDRDRDRERDRERYRERDRGDSSGWKGVGTSRRPRERSWSADREKERSRERERHRDHRDRYR